MNADRKSLVLVDGTNFFYRSFYAMPDHPKGAVMTMRSLLKGISRLYPSDYVACVFDDGKSSDRVAIYPQYKEGRPGMPEAMKAQLDETKEAIELLGWHVLSHKGVEADDVIGTLARVAAEAEMNVLICSTDKDISQLVNEYITALDTLNNKWRDYEGVLYEFGVPPELMIDYQALCGDTVDNIPGVAKVGGKTAVKLLETYGSLDNIILNADKISGTLGVNLRAALPLLPLYKKLVTIDTHIDLSATLVGFPSLESLSYQGETMLTVLKNHQQATSLAQELVRAQAAYHNTHEPILSDDEYNAKVKLLDEFEKAHGAVKVKWRNVGAEVPTGYRKVKHLFPMLSLKTLTDTTNVPVGDYLKTIAAHVKDEPIEILIEPKWDGLAVAPYYFNGALQQISTRGDGIEGEDVSRLMKGRIIDLPHHIDHIDAIEVRGELLISRKNFEAVNALRRRDGQEEYANTRNAVAGIVRMLDGGDYLDLLTFRAYDVMSTLQEFKTHQDKVDFLKKQGFTYQILGFIEATPTQAEDIYKVYTDFGERRPDFLFDTDGVVYKLNNVELSKKIPGAEDTPGWAVAHKFEAQEAITLLKDIKLQVGRTGRITPVAELEPVTVGGVEVSSANLKNEDEIKKLDVRPGENVVVHRAGDVIPEIKSAMVIEPGKRPAAWKFPEHCPECGGFLTRDPDEAIHYCNNRTRCPDQIAAYWEYVVSRPVLNLQGFGPSAVEKLLAAGHLQILPDLWELTEEKLLAAGLGKADSAKIAAEIKRINQLVDLWRVYTALGIRGVAVSTCKDLARAYPTIPELVAATQSSLELIEGIGPVTAEAILQYVQSENGVVTLARLDGMLRDKFVTQIEDDSKEWLGKAVLTGQFKGYTQAEVAEMVETVMLYKVVNNITMDTTALIVGSHPSKDKLDRAKQLGIDIMTDMTFKKF